MTDNRKNVKFLDESIAPDFINRFYNFNNKNNISNSGYPHQEGVASAFVV